MAELDALLAQAAAAPKSVYLFIGEPFQTEAAARALIDRLVPPEKRSFSLEQVDGRSTAIGPILDSLRTPSLFGGTKLIWVREPTLFLSGEKRGDIAEALFTALDEAHPLEAAEKLLVLAALAVKHSTAPGGGPAARNCSSWPLSSRKVLTVRPRSAHSLRSPSIAAASPASRARPKTAL